MDKTTNILSEKAVGEDSLPDIVANEEYDIAKKINEARRSGLLCDVFFEVGEEKRAFFAHRLILAVSSPVFRTDFVGDILGGTSKENPTLVPDVDPNAFELMLNFIYLGQRSNSIEITDQLVVHLLYAAVKYQIPQLKLACTQHLNRIHACNAATILLQALRYNDPSIANACCESVCSNSSAFLNSEGFLKCDRQALEMILGSDSFEVENEMFLLRRLLKWVSLKCDEQEMEETTKVKRDVLGNLIYCVRFPLMNMDELKEVALMKILTDAELGQLFLHLQCPSESCGNFVTRPRPRSLKAGKEISPITSATAEDPPRVKPSSSSSSPSKSSTEERPSTEAAPAVETISSGLLSETSPVSSIAEEPPREKPPPSPSSLSSSSEDEQSLAEAAPAAQTVPSGPPPGTQISPTPTIAEDPPRENPSPVPFPFVVLPGHPPAPPHVPTGPRIPPPWFKGLRRIQRPALMPGEGIAPMPMPFRGPFFKRK